MTSAAGAAPSGSRVGGAGPAATSWLEGLDPPPAGESRAAAGPLLRIPAPQAEEGLRQTIRLVADLPRSSTPQLVWVQGADELLVHLDDVGLACDEGLVTISVRVSCEELDRDAVVTIPLGVGTAELPTGLVMSTLTRPLGPALVVDVWAEAFTALAWEALVHLAQVACEARGRRESGRALVPVLIGAAPQVLLILPGPRSIPVVRPRPSAPRAVER